MNRAGHLIHAEAAADVVGRFLPRGKPGAEDHGDGGAAVHGGRLLEAKELLTERRLLQRLCTDSDAIVLEDELVSVGGGREGDLDRAGLVLVLGAAHYRTLDAVHGGIAQHVNQAALDRGEIGAGHLDRKSTRLNSSHTVISYAV